MNGVGRVLRALLIVPVTLGLTALPASAEWFADLYAGVAVTPDSDVTVRAPGQRQTVTGEFDTSLTGGGRVGYWLAGLPWLGVAADVSYFAPDVKPSVAPGGATTDLDVVPIAALLMLRLPLLATPEIPGGRIQPYAAAGPAAFVTHAKESLAGERISDVSVDLGLDVRAGVAWQFHRNVALFGEYRFTHVSPKFEGTSLGQTFSIEPEIDTHHFLAGVSFRFP